MANQTKAEQWLQQIDRPLKQDGWTAGIDRNTVKQMKRAATDVLQDASPRCTDIYVFADGSGLWEKRPEDWFLADPETIAAAQEGQ